MSTVSLGAACRSELDVCMKNVAFQTLRGGQNRPLAFAVCQWSQVPSGGTEMVYEFTSFHGTGVTADGLRRTVAHRV